MSSRGGLTDLLSEAGRVGILHHWDADGISSAAQVIRWAQERGVEPFNRSPAIGDYTGCVDRVGALLSQRPEVILGLDLAVTTDTLEEIASTSSVKTIWVDHHSHPPLPPKAVAFFHPDQGLGSESNSWFLTSLLGGEPDLLSAIGVCGDLGRRLLEAGIRGRVEGVASSYGLSLGDLFAITDLLDSNYRADDQRGVEDAPHVLLDKVEEPERLLEVGEWLARKEMVDAELERVMSIPCEERGRVIIKTIDTKMHLTSIVARRSALAYRGRAKAVIVRNVGREVAPFYVRGVERRIDLSHLIDWGRKMGFSAGGKREVVGMLAPRGAIPRLTEATVKFLEES